MTERNRNRRTRDWIVIDGIVNQFVCQRCGTREGIQLPERFEIIAMQGKLFLAKHKDCEETK